MDPAGLIKRITDHIGQRSDRFFKTTLFHSPRLMLGLNCLEPGQVQAPHDHADQDKFYYVVSGTGRFQLAEYQVTAGPGEGVWSPAGMVHGVSNDGPEQLVLLLGIAPAP